MLKGEGRGGRREKGEEHAHMYNIAKQIKWQGLQ